jgi:hypothetical protein
MTLEANIFSALNGLVPSTRVFPDTAPQGVAKPYITYQQVGGQAVNLLESTTAGKRNARIQVNCWDVNRQSVANLARAVEDAITSSTTLRGYVLGAMTAVFEEDLLLYGTRQDFSIWY